jgi:hypothetical protein
MGNPCQRKKKIASCAKKALAIYKVSTDRLEYKEHVNQFYFFSIYMFVMDLP